MEALWFWIISLMLVTYVVLDGFDFGVGIVHLAVARTDAERRTVLSAIGPIWDGNEVWLVASGGVLVFAFPRVYAAAFSGFYLPLTMVLWLLVLRGISIEFRSRQSNPLWRSFWDVTLGFSSATLAVVFGVALGNVLRGVPVDDSGYFATPLFTDFRLGPHLGALDWFTLLVGAMAWCTLSAHGALFLNWKTGGEVQRRSRRAAWALWAAVVVVGAAATVATAAVQPSILQHMLSRRWLWLMPFWIVASLLAVFWFLRKGHELGAFLGSSSFIASMLVATAAGLFPVFLRSTVDPAYTLDAYGASSGPRALTAGLGWWLPALFLAVLYFAYLFRSMRGKANPDEHY